MGTTVLLYSAIVFFIASGGFSLSINAGFKTKPEGMENQIFSFINSIIPQAQTINFENVLFMIALLIIFHALITSIIMKMIDGGSWYSAIFDFVFMTWIGAILSYILPKVVGEFLPSFAGVWGG